MEAIAKSISLIQKNEVKLIENDPLQKHFTFPTRQNVLEFQNNGKKFF